MKTFFVCIICNKLFGCEIDGVKRNCVIDCDCDGTAGNIENSVCDKCVRDVDWQV